VIRRVSADGVYGTGDIETALRKAGNGYVLGIACNHVSRTWGRKTFITGTALQIANAIPLEKTPPRRTTKPFSSAGWSRKSVVLP
jgi:hypothetical protein